MTTSIANMSISYGLFNGSHVEKQFAFAPQAPEITERRLGDGVYALRALLRRGPQARRPGDRRVD